jgi:biopolymer transport protein TolR
VAAMKSDRRPFAEINVTPFVDVVLVLLIIFMVTAPMMQQGIDVDLPKTTTQNLRVHNEPLIIT